MLKLINVLPIALLAIIMIACSKEELMLDQNLTNSSSIDAQKLTEHIASNWQTILSEKRGNLNSRIEENFVILTDNAYKLTLSDGFETVVVPVKNTDTEELSAVILGGQVNYENLYPAILKDGKNESIFSLSNKLIQETAEDNNDPVYFCANEVVLICELDISCNGNNTGPCWICTAFDAIVYNGCPPPGSTSGADDWGSNNGGDGNDSNSGEDGSSDGSNDGNGSNGSSSSGSNSNTSTDENENTTEEIIVISYTTEQIVNQVKDCTGLTEGELNAIFPLSTDQNEFLAVILLEQLEQYNIGAANTSNDNQAIDNLSSYDQLNNYLNNLDVNSFEELVESVLNYLDGYNENAEYLRTMFTMLNWNAALNCAAWEGLFDFELNSEMFLITEGFSEAERQLYNDLSLRERWQYLLSGGQARTAAFQLFPNAVRNDCIMLNGAGDAFRHALWNALSGWRLGEFTARQLTTAHEDRPPNPNVPFQELEVEMDLFNNNVGLNINDLEGFEEIHDAVLASFQNGELRMISNTEMIGEHCRATNVSNLIVAN